MASKRIDRERIARLLVDAILLGDKTAAVRHKVSEKTVQRHRKRLTTDAELSEIVQKLGRDAEHGWHFRRSQFLRRTLDKLDEMVQNAGPDDFEHVIEALRAAGDLDLASEALGLRDRDNREGPAAPEDQG